MSESMSQDDYRILFAKCARCSHGLAEHESAGDGFARSCFASLGVTGHGERITCSCMEFDRAYPAQEESR